MKKLLKRLEKRNRQLGQLKEQAKRIAIECEKVKREWIYYKKEASEAVHDNELIRLTTLKIAEHFALEPHANTQTLLLQCLDNVKSLSIAFTSQKETIAKLEKESERTDDLLCNIDERLKEAGITVASGDNYWGRLVDEMCHAVIVAKESQKECASPKLWEELKAGDEIVLLRDYRLFDKTLQRKGYDYTIESIDGSSATLRVTSGVTSGYYRLTRAQYYTYFYNPDWKDLKKGQKVHDGITLYDVKNIYSTHNTKLMALKSTGHSRTLGIRRYEKDFLTA